MILNFYSAEPHPRTNHHQSFGQLSPPLIPQILLAFTISRPISLQGSDRTTLPLRASSLHLTRISTFWNIQRHRFLRYIDSQPLESIKGFVFPVPFPFASCRNEQTSPQLHPEPHLRLGLLRARGYWGSSGERSWLSLWVDCSGRRGDSMAGGKLQVLRFGDDIWDSSHRFETSWLLSPWALFAVRALIVSLLLADPIFHLGPSSWRLANSWE